MLDLYYKKLDLYVDINELSEYFSIIEKKYDNLKWTYDRHKDNVSDKWHDIFNSNKGNEFYSGWSIVSNLPDGEVCPPLNESITKSRLDYFKDTELSFGIVKRLQEKIPFAYKWAIISQPTNGKVFKHDDRGEYVTHIVIQTSPECIFRFYKNDHEFLDFNLPADGHLYTLNTELKHETWNNGIVRHSLIFVIKKEDYPELEALNGKI